MPAVPAGNLDKEHGTPATINPVHKVHLNQAGPPMNASGQEAFLALLAGFLFFKSLP